MDGESLGDEVFKILGHRGRRLILRLLGEGSSAEFNELLGAAFEGDSPALSYHLREMTPLLVKEDSTYSLSKLGVEAYGLVKAAAGMEGKLLHMGMGLTEEEHDRWHAEGREPTPEEHAAMMRRMGISEEEDRKWHGEHGVPRPEDDERPVNPYAVGGGFLEYCVRQGWIIREGSGRSARYASTAGGREELRRFGIISGK